MPEIRCRRCGEPVPRGEDHCSHCGAPAPEDVTNVSGGAQTRFSVGDVIDARYEIVGVLPTGGMGELYKVRHVHLGDFRVVKVRKPMGKKDETSQKRFAREARLAAALKHPNLATLYDFSMTPDGAHYMVFEYVDGMTVAEHIKAGGRFETIQVLRVAEQTLKALSVLHNAGIIHRDIASDNLMLAVAPDGETIVKVIDLGIAKPLDGEGLTSTGFFVGKARYASPEQVNTQDPTPIDARSDLYSLGVVLYEMVSGDVPFAGSTPAASVIKRLTEDVTAVPPRDTAMILESDVEAFILSLLRRDRDERVHDADDALEALRDLLAKRPDADDGSTLARITRDRELHKLVAESEPADIPVPRKGTLEMSLDEIQKAQLNDLREATEHGPLDTSTEEPPHDQPHVSETESLPKLDKEARDRLMAEKNAATADTDQIPIDERPDDDASPEIEPDPIPAEESPDNDAPTMPFKKYKRIPEPEPEAESETPPGASPSTPFLTGESGAGTLPIPALANRPTSGTTPEPPAVSPRALAPEQQPLSQEKSPAAPPAPPPSSTAYKAAPSPAYTPPSDVDSRKKTMLTLALLLVFALMALGVAAYSVYRIVQKISTEPVASAGVQIEEVDVSAAPVDFVESEISEVSEYGPPLPDGFVEPKPPPPPKPEPRTAPSKPEPEPEPEPPEPEPEPEPEPPPEPPVLEGELVQPGPDVQDASIIAKGPLRLPVRARLRRAKGTATVDILIGINGVPDEVRMVKRSGDADIDDAVLEAARNSRFIPATKDGVRVRIWKRLDFGNED